MDEESIEAAVQLLLISAVRLTALCLPHLESSGHGRIVNITSSTVKEPVDNLALSNTVRPGVVGWSKTLARELGPKGVTVNCIAPGRIDTERLKEVYPDGPYRGRPGDDPAGPPGNDRARSATSWRSSAPTAAHTSPARRSPSTAACSAPCSRA